MYINVIIWAKSNDYCKIEFDLSVKRIDLELYKAFETNPCKVKSNTIFHGTEEKKSINSNLVI